MSGRFFRSTREAFPCERFPAVFGPFSKPARGERMAGVALAVVLGIVGAALLVHWLAK